MSIPEEQPLNGKAVPKENNVRKKTFKEKLKNIKDNITLEPVLMCHVIPGLLQRLANQNLNLDKVCRVNKAYGDEICDALIARKGNNYDNEEIAIQEVIAGMERWKNVLLTIIPSILILFIGAWSDRTGKRKICILLPIVGDLITCLSNILSAYYFYEFPVTMAVFCEAFFPAITGGWITTYMGAFAYIADVTSEDSRTFRIGIANLCLTAGGPIGSVLSGLLLERIGYYGVFGISTILYLFSIIYGFINIKDPERPVTEKPVKNESSNMWDFLKSFFDMKHVKDTCTVAFRKGPNHRRLKSILILTTIVFVYGPHNGENTVRYLFCRFRFNWDALKYSIFNTFYICIHLLGALTSISLFSHYLKWHDAVLGLVSSVSKVLGALTTGLARNTMEMYISVAIEMFNATSFTAMRSIFSKLCTSDELGKMTSFFNLVEVTTAMVFGPLYSWIYMVTLKIDTSIMYYISIVLTIPPLVIFGGFLLENRRRSLRNDNEIENKPVTEMQIKKKKDSLVSSLDLEYEKIVTDK